MPVINYQATNFPAAYHPLLTGRQSLAVTWAELVWAAISVGRRELLHLFRYGPFSTFEIVYRAAVLYANLCETLANTLTRSSAYDGLDPSEKSAISYFMGMTLAKLFADKLLDVPWLMHLDVYRDELQPILTAGRSRPDLVGQNSAQQWIAIESKGRTNEFDANPLERAKEQVENLASVQGTAITLNVAFLAYFDEGILECAINDPDKKKTADGTEVIDLPLTREKLIEGYYRPFREWLPQARESQQETIGNNIYRVAYLPEVDIAVGCNEDLLQGVDLPHVARTRERSSTETQYEAPDGLLVRVGELWSEANMRLQPQERR